MEKGSSPRPSAAKANTEAKFKQDGYIKYQRCPKYKDDTSARSDARFKPSPQKSKEVYDKRPRLRGGTVCQRYRNEVAYDYSVGSFSKQGSKKVNLNHLLNFTLAPSDSRDYSSRPARNKARFPKYNKELFLQANCQFVIRDDSDYTQQWSNPDILVDWPLIEEIRLPSHEVPSCPICLYTPVAAKITRCGHIYCWSCMLHYLALTDKTWQKCPICFEAVNKHDLKSVLPVTQQHFMVGNKIVMCLVRREKGCFFPVPISHKSSTFAYHVNSDEKVTCFQKLLLANQNDIRNVIKRERTELTELWLREKEAPESCFVESALKMLNEREDALETNISMKGSEQNASNKNFCNANVEVSTEWSATSTIDIDNNQTDLSQMDPIAKSASHGSIIEAENRNKKGKEAYYFYQAADGQHIYLSSLNVRMLVKEFGSLELSPLFIEAEILELEKLSMTEESRKRLRYLQHVPLTCEFQVAELNINSLLSKSTVLEFSAEVVRRQNLRRKKLCAEVKRQKFLELEENRKLGKYPGATYNLQSTHHFPVYALKNEINCNVPPYESSPPCNMPNQDYDVQYPSVGISNLSIQSSCDSSPPTTSFAKVLQSGHVNFNNGSSNKVQKNSPHHEMDRKPELSDEESHMLVPEYRNSFSSALEAALNTAMTERNAVEKRSSKKKKRNKILFSTAMCHGK